MKLKREILLFLLILVTGTSFNDLFSQTVKPKPTRQSSFEAFSEGNYEKAYDEFSVLLQTYTKDPLYKYYSGVCLVQLKREPAEAVRLLQQALQGAAVVKTLPSDAMFYLGKAQQMSGKFSEAIGSYNFYTEEIGKRKSREQGVPQLIQECNEKKGAVSEIKPTAVVSAKKEDDVIIQADNKPVVKESVSEPAKMAVTAKMAIPTGYEKILEEALDFQFKADSLNTLVNEQKKELLKLPPDDQAVMKVKISDNLALAASFQKLADQKYSEAQAAMNPQLEKNAPKEALQQSNESNITGSVETPDNKVITATVKSSDATQKMEPVINKPAETFVFFEVLPKPVTDPSEKILIDPEVPVGLIYRIQVAVFRNPVAPVVFKGITPIYGFKVPGTDRTNYYAGMFRRSADARKALASVKAKGFNDAFVVALLDKKSVSSDRAAILEKEWGSRPFQENRKILPETSADTLPPTLTFRVEVVRSLKPLKEEIVVEIKKLAGTRGMDIQTLEDGEIAYLIGKFITFESAEEYADLLIRNGYRETKVVAWLGKKEIPLETARQLFDNLK